MHPLCGAVPVPYVPVRVTRSALVAHRYTYAPPRCRTSQNRRTFIPLSSSLWNDLTNSLLDGMVLAGLKSQGQCFFIGLAARFLLVFYCFTFLFFVSIDRHCGAGVFGLIRCNSLSPSLTLPTFFKRVHRVTPDLIQHSQNCNRSTMSNVTLKHTPS